jgi:hypothetical protein
MSEHEVSTYIRVVKASSFAEIQRLPSEGNDAAGQAAPKPDL